MQLLLHPLTPDLYRVIGQIHEHYDLWHPPMPEEALAVVAMDTTTREVNLVASVYLYDTGPFLWAEFGIGNPNFHVRARHHAASILAEAFIARANLRGQQPLAAPRSMGVAMILRRAGFSRTYTELYTHSTPLISLGPLPEPKVATPVAKSESPPTVGSEGDSGGGGDDEPPPPKPKVRKRSSRVKKKRAKRDV